MKRFPSIRKNSEFQKVYRDGTSYADRLLIMYVKSGERPESRIGISVSKKVGNSVVRHRVTRVIREVFREHREEIFPGLDIVVIARPAAGQSDFRKLEGAYLHLCGLHHIRKESK